MTLSGILIESKQASILFEITTTSCACYMPTTILSNVHVGTYLMITRSFTHLKEGKSKA